MTTTSIAAMPALSSLRLAARKKTRIIGALLLCACVSACGFLQLTYNNAPELIFHWLDGYLDFDDAQAPRVRAEIAQLQRWHRAHALPRYAGLLERLAAHAPGELGTDTACRVQDEVQQHFARLLEEAEPAIAAIALDLSRAQLQHLKQQFEKRNTKFRKQWLDKAPPERLEARLERAVGNAERVYGRLDEPQRVLLREQLAALPFDPAERLAETQRRQRDALATLERMTADSAWTAAQLRATVHGLLERMRRSPDAAQRHDVRQQSCANIASLHNSTSPAQRTHAIARLRGWARDLRELGRAR